MVDGRVYKGVRRVLVGLNVMGMWTNTLFEYIARDYPYTRARKWEAADQCIYVPWWGSGNAAPVERGRFVLCGRNQTVVTPT